MSPPSPLANPSIQAVLSAFLAEQKARLSVKSYRQYETAVQLFTHSLNNYAWSSLEEEDGRTFKHYARTDKPLQFCEIFGPEHIPENVGEFLGYFMKRKVVPSRELDRSIAVMLRRLASWMQERGYIDEEAMEEMITRAKGR